MGLAAFDYADGRVDGRGQVERLREVVERAQRKDAERVLGVHQPPNDPPNGSVAARDDDQAAWRDQLLQVHLGVEFDDHAAFEGFAEPGFDRRRHRTRLGAQDQQAASGPGRALALGMGRRGHYDRLPMSRIQRAQAREWRPSATNPRAMTPNRTRPKAWPNRN